MINSFFFRKNSSVYEIYPQSETPCLTQIAHLDFDLTKNRPALLLPCTVISYDFLDYDDSIVVFRVWDYRLNHSISFSVDVDVSMFKSDLKVYFILSKALKSVSNSFVGS